MKHSEEAVILLHGIFLTSLHMKRLENALNLLGYNVYNISYPSTKYSISDLIDLLGVVCGKGQKTTLSDFP